MTPFLSRYGLSPYEMAVLLAGGHGLKDAEIQTRWGPSSMSSKNSGTTWIEESLDTHVVWIYYNGTIGLEKPGFEPYFEGSNGIGRLPVDMVN
jgi:hypothetical protein